jgi:hypothetical protein
MKKLFFFLIVIAGFTACIKKKAIKYDPGLVGTWVSNSDSTIYSWLIITPDGIGTYSTYGNNEADVAGEVKYSLFERKMWIGKEKFKVEVWRSGRLDGIGQLPAKEYKTLKDTVYDVVEKMVLKTGALGRSIDFYKIKQ